MSLLLTHNFISYTNHLKIFIGLLSYADLPNIDTFRVQAILKTLFVSITFDLTRKVFRYWEDIRLTAAYIRFLKFIFCLKAQI